MEKKVSFNVAVDITLSEGVEWDEATRDSVESAFGASLQAAALQTGAPGAAFGPQPFAVNGATVSSGSRDLTEV